MKRHLFTVLLAFGLMASFPAFALTLQEARAAGILGEKADGYVKVLKKSAEAEALARDINEKRRQEYMRISRENEQPVEIVSRLAAEQIIKGLKPGEYFQDAAGEWQAR
jgi:uncharacterized protein